MTGTKYQHFRVDRNHPDLIFVKEGECLSFLKDLIASNLQNGAPAGIRTQILAFEAKSLSSPERKFADHAPSDQ